MEPARPEKPRVFIGADVLFAGSASPNEHSASNLILRMSELTLIEAITSTQVITEVERNLLAKLPKALPAFRMLVSRCLKIVEDPNPDLLLRYRDLADPEDLPILAAAIEGKCSFLTTFNLRHFQPGWKDLTVLKPGNLVIRVRYLLAHLNE